MKTRHLSDCFTEAIAYVIFFLKTPASRQMPYDQVRAAVLRVLSQGEEEVKKGLFSREDYENGRFALCAWIDEAVLNSSWNQKMLWQREQLQRFFYGTTEAGEEFFERLNNLGPHQREVREVYFLCLALGFSGRYSHPGDEPLLEHLKTSNLRLLVGTSVGIPSLEGRELFPEAYPMEGMPLTTSRRGGGVWILAGIALAAPVILFGGLFLIFRTILTSAGGNF